MDESYAFHFYASALNKENLIQKLYLNILDMILFGWNLLKENIQSYFITWKNILKLITDGP